MNFSALFFQGSISGNTLTFSSSVANLSGGNYLWDMDDSTTINSGDILALSGSLQAPYSGYGIIPNGTTTMYPIFGPDSGGRYWIPHDNTISQANFASGVTVYPLTVFCFHAGTLIHTPTGETTLEDLAIGDPVLTADGRVVPVKWIGRQTVSTRFGAAERLMPVRFAAGSLGHGLPQSDLTVTADHGMLVEGVICHAGALVNGTTITRVPLAEMGESYTVYHVETDAHEIILANGAPAETFIDNMSRRVFDNVAEFDALYGDVPEMEEL